MFRAVEQRIYFRRVRARSFMRLLGYLVAGIIALSAVPLPHASAAGYGICTPDKCVGAVASVAGGCAVMAGEALYIGGTNMQVCANTAVAAAGAVAVVITFAVVNTRASATDLGLDPCNLYETHLEIPPDLAIEVACGSAAGSLGDCVAAEAQATAKTVTGPKSTPIASAEAGCDPEDLLVCPPAVEETGLCRDVTGQTKLSDLSEEDQQSLRAAIWSAVEDDFVVVTAGWGSEARAERLREILYDSLYETVMNLDGDVEIRPAS